MKITQEEVSHVAKLSKLAFSPEETAEFATTLSKIVDMVELLNEVDTEGVPFTSNVAAQTSLPEPSDHESADCPHQFHSHSRRCHKRDCGIGLAPDLLQKCPV